MALKVERIRTLVEERAGRVSWGDNDVIAHGRFGEDGLYDLCTIRPDGSDVREITSGNPRIAQLQNGQPTWHPSGRFIVFQSQDPSLPRSREIDRTLADPGAGIHSNLWAVDPEGESFHPLTRIGPGQYTLHSHFSHDGRRLTWSQNDGLMIADFVESPAPRLENISELHPIPEGLETHSFTRDNAGALFTAMYHVCEGRKLNRLTEVRSAGVDPAKLRLVTAGIHEVDFSTQAVRHVVGDPSTWDEHAHYSPDSRHLIWSTSRGYPYPGRTTSEVMATTRLEYWVMDADGSNQTQLTWFNRPGHAHYVGAGPPAKPVDFSWSPDGMRIVACILRGVIRELATIVVIDLAEA